MSSAVYIQGATVKASCIFKDTTGNLVDPTEVHLKYKTPSNVVVTKSSSVFEIEKKSIGSYECFVLLDEVGKYAFRWEGTGSNGSISENVITVIASKVL
jgi:hypothetical protein